jgi:hypothetical protein
MQLFINVKRGLVVSPFYHYGMYSKPMAADTTYQVAEIYVNGRLLRSDAYTAQQWDKIIQPVVLYQNQQSWNSYLYNEQVARLLHIQDSLPYTNRLTKAGFAAWYRTYLESFAVQESVQHLKVTFSQYRFTIGQHPQLQDSTQLYFEE